MSNESHPHFSGDTSCKDVSSCRGQVSGGSTDTAGDVRDTTNGLWHHYLLTTRPDGADGYNVYIDGVLRAADPYIEGVGGDRNDFRDRPANPPDGLPGWQTTGGDPTDPVGPIRLCGRAKPGSWVGRSDPWIWDERRYFLGKVAHFAVWDHSMTAEQAVALHNAYTSKYKIAVVSMTIVLAGDIATFTEARISVLETRTLQKLQADGVNGITGVHVVRGALSGGRRLQEAVSFQATILFQFDSTETATAGVTELSTKFGTPSSASSYLTSPPDDDSTIDLSITVETVLSAPNLQALKRSHHSLGPGACRGSGGMSDKVNMRYAVGKLQSKDACEAACDVATLSSSDEACSGYSWYDSNEECILYGCVMTRSRTEASQYALHTPRCTCSPGSVIPSAQSGYGWLVLGYGTNYAECLRGQGHLLRSERPDEHGHK